MNLEIISAKVVFQAGRPSSSEKGLKRGQSPGPEHVDVGDAGEQVWGIRAQSDGDGRALSFRRTSCFRGTPVFLAQSQSHQRPQSPSTHGSLLRVGRPGC